MQMPRKYHDVAVVFSNNSNFTNNTKIVYNNDTNNSLGLGVGSDSEYAESASGKDISFNTVTARYMRIYSNGNTVNNGNHYVEVQAFGKPSKDALLGQTATASGDIFGAQQATDGILDSEVFAEAGNGAQYIQYDLGASKLVENIQLWHYFADGRTYKDVVVRIANKSDFSDAWNVYNNDTRNELGLGAGGNSPYAETINGLTIPVSEWVSFRYIRFYSKGSNVNTTNHYSEVKVNLAPWQD